MACKAFFGFSGESGPMIYWMKGEKFIEELEGHIREGEVRYFLEYLLLKNMVCPKILLGFLNRFLIRGRNSFLPKE